MFLYLNNRAVSPDGAQVANNDKKLFVIWKRLKCHREGIISVILIFANEEFPKLLTSIQKAAIFVFLGKDKAKNYQELVENMLKNFKVIGRRMALKVPCSFR